MMRRRDHMVVEVDSGMATPVILVLGVGFVGVYWKFVLMVLTGFVLLTGVAWVMLMMARGSKEKM